MSIELFQATLQDTREVHLVRNDPQVRKYLFSREFISFEDHQNWFSKKINQNIDYIYLIRTEPQRQLVGTLRFDYLKKSSYNVSILLLPGYHGYGLGKRSVLLGLKKLNKIIKTGSVVAKVMHGNVASSKLFLSCGFTQTHANGEYLSYEK